MLRAVLLVLPLGLDTFAIAAALGLARVPSGARLRVSLLLSAFESAAPLLGLGLGEALGQAVSGVADYMAICVLLAFAAYMLLADEDEEQSKIGRLLQVRGVAAVMLGLSVSIDEVAIGFTLGLLDVPLVPVLIAIALQALVLSQLGLRLGARLGERAHEGAERLAGLVLGVLAIELLAEKLAA